MKETYFAATVERGGRFASLVLSVENGANLLLRLQNTQGLTFITPCDSKRQADELVYFWNESHKKNGVYLYTP